MLEKRLRPFVAVVGFYLVLAVIYAVRRWNTEFLYYAVIMLGQIACVIWLDRKVRLPTWVLWSLALWGFLHMLGGSMLIPERFADSDTGAVTLYSLRLEPWLPRYDQTIHTFGFTVASMTAWCGIRTLLAPRRHGRIALWSLVWLCGMGLGALNEVIEFVATRILPSTNVGGYSNTGWDLVSNLLGAAIGGVWAVVDHRRARGGQSRRLS
jgi:uncharacterized membrane protein YjdF